MKRRKEWEDKKRKDDREHRTEKGEREMLCSPNFSSLNPNNNRSNKNNNDNNPRIDRPGKKRAFGPRFKLCDRSNK